MFPWVYGFRWDAGNIIFLGSFFSVVVVIATTVMVALFRSWKDVKGRKAEKIVWAEEFKDLPASARKCRHELAGEVDRRLCTNQFDCRECTTHGKFLEKGSPAGEMPTAWVKNIVYGLRIPLDRFYHRGHTWARIGEDGMITVGLDGFGLHLLGTPDATEFPAVGTKVFANGTGWRFRKGKAHLRVLSPVDGEVIETGGPEKGWYLKIHPGTPTPDLKHLLRGSEVRLWMMREMEHLQLALGSTGVGMSLADGGELTDDIAASYPDADWDAVWGEIMLG